jgi:hypothetical protein
VHATNLPESLKLKHVEAVIDYEPETIAGRRVLLPTVAAVQVMESSGTERVSRLSFNHCRTFAATSDVIFDGADAGQSSDPVRQTALPADLNVVVLLPAIDSAAARENDVLTATVAEPVKVKGEIFIEAGATVEGHLRPSRGETAVMVEFDRVQTRHGWMPFHAHLVSVTPDNRRGETADQATAAYPAVPGVAKVFLPEAGPMEAGARMNWRTEVLGSDSLLRPPEMKTTIGLH